MDFKIRLPSWARQRAADRLGLPTGLGPIQIDFEREAKLSTRPHVDASTANPQLPQLKSAMGPNYEPGGYAAAAQVLAAASALGKNVSWSSPAFVIEGSKKVTRQQLEAQLAQWPNKYYDWNVLPDNQRDAKGNLRVVMQNP